MWVSFGNASGPVEPFPMLLLAQKGSLYVTRPTLNTYTSKREDLVATANDLFAVVFATPAIIAIWLGVRGIDWLLPVGLGITTYGAIYFLFHDGLVHRRWPMPKPRSPYWKRLIQAHRFHHAVHTKHGAVSFGFLLAPDVRKLKAQLASRGVQV
jgi:hypothetical protein